MKKWIAGLVCMFVAVAFVGCSGGEQPASSSAPTEAAPAADAMPAEAEDAPPAGSAAKAMPEEATEASEPEAAESVSEAVEEVMEDAAEVVEEAAEVVEEAVAGGSGLAGTKWTLDDVEVEFKDDKMLTLKGGMIKSLGLDSLDAEYTVVDGKFTMSAMGQSREGTWDGTTLVIDGTTATPAS